MNLINISAKTYDEAITKALIELQTTSEHIAVEIIEKGTSGFFGIIGGKPCVITARVMSEEEEKEKKELEAKAIKEKLDVEAKIEADKKNIVAKAEADKKNIAAKAEADKKNIVAKAEADKKLKADKFSSDNNIIETAVNKNDIGNSDFSEEENSAKSKKEVSREEAELLNKKACEFLDAIFKTMEMTVVVKAEFDHKENEMLVSLVGEDMGILIGKRGQTLDSLQYLVSLVVNKHHDGYIRVKLDTENYRERRKEKLETLAHNIARKVKKTRTSVTLEPMNPYERRIIHSALQNDPYVTTKSQGEDPYRQIVIVLKNNYQRAERKKPEYSGEKRQNIKAK